MPRTSHRPRPAHIPALALNLVLALALASLLGAPAAAGESGLPLPRFVSLRADKVNVRTGPGVRYPVDWVFVRRGLPVEVVAEFEHWRKVRDWEGTEGWVHQSMLSGARSVLVAGKIRALRARPAANAAVVARAEPGVVAELLECEGDWCRVEAAGFRGWIRRADAWGAAPGAPE